jgi:hypothetical protein
MQQQLPLQTAMPVILHLIYFTYSVINIIIVFDKIEFKAYKIQQVKTTYHIILPLIIFPFD